MRAEQAGVIANWGLMSSQEHHKIVRAACNCFTYCSPALPGAVLVVKLLEIFKCGISPTPTPSSPLSNTDVSCPNTERSIIVQMRKERLTGKTVYSEQPDLKISEEIAVGIFSCLAFSRLAFLIWKCLLVFVFMMRLLSQNKAKTCSLIIFLNKKMIAAANVCWTWPNRDRVG